VSGHPPDSVRLGVERALEGVLGRRVRVVSSRSVGGGCVSASARLDTDDGGAWFAKWNADAGAGLFVAEADGLAALAAAAGKDARVPEVAGVGGRGVPSDPGWIVMEYLPAGQPSPDYSARLGRGLAELHARPGPDPAGGAFGWPTDNFIGSLPQANAPLGDWPSFWRERRLEPQVRLARDSGALSAGEGRPLEALLDDLDTVLAGAAEEGPSLLHGDLWGGNVFPGSDGTPVLIDPAVYRGHREVDLAMSELFGFPGGFLPAYREAWPTDLAYDRVRRHAYQLYYLLVHVNLFGRSYMAPSLDAARRALAGR